MKDRTQEFVDFCTKNGRLPRKREQGSLRSWGLYHKKSSPEVKAMFEKYSGIMRGKLCEIDRTQEFVDFCEEHKRLPRKKEQRSLYAWAKLNRRKNPTVDTYIRTYTSGRGHKMKNRTEEVMKFYEETGRIPRKTSGSEYERMLGRWARENKDTYPEISKLFGEAGERIPAEFILPWVVAKAEYDLCAKYAFTTELKKEMETEIMKQNIYTVSEAELILKKFLGGLSRDPRWYDIPENRADLIASIMQKEKED